MTVDTPQLPHPPLSFVQYSLKVTVDVFIQYTVQYYIAKAHFVDPNTHTAGNFPLLGSCLQCVC